MSSHVTLSPSKRFRFSVCSGSVREQAKFPDSGSGPAAIDGTHSHTLLDTCIKSGFWPDTYVGQTLTDHEGEFTVDKARADRVRVAVDYVHAASDGARVLAESRVEPNWLIGRSDMGGTVDIQIHDTANHLLELIDYKDGINDAWHSAVLQMEQYAIGVLAGFKLPINGDYPFDTIRLTVIQPKLSMRGGVPVRSKDYSLSQILAIIPTLVKEAAATDAPDAPLVPGESQCKYCRAKGSCSALASNVMKEIGVMFQPVSQPQLLDVAQQSANKDPNTMSDQQIREIMEAAPLMRQLLDGVEAEALRRFQAGQAIPGFKAVYGKGSRAWTLSDDETAACLSKMKIPKELIWETKLVSVAKAEKLTWEKTKGGEKVKMQLSDHQLKVMHSEYVTKLAGKLTIVPESDSRPAVMMNAAPLFSAVEEVLPAWLTGGV